MESYPEPTGHRPQQALSRRRPPAPEGASSAYPEDAAGVGGDACDEDSLRARMETARMRVDEVFGPTADDVFCIRKATVARRDVEAAIRLYTMLILRLKQQGEAAGEAYARRSVLYFLVGAYEHSERDARQCLGESSSTTVVRATCSDASQTTSPTTTALARAGVLPPRVRAVRAVPF